eukprot:CAMPEP_0194195048 /NCGR_PEP_ID=MMETSP0154-20130528/75916_1 /TAXON_ID=1049557 /ORGANISM="Thalassiothrix antarctica, Strain L6-D1" /LENGTH=442 /DNA_ID=CAMNT_0038919535 /DNA_START=555 /DNA_END=1883 /DNA_ORIENTATION=+
MSGFPTTSIKTKCQSKTDNDDKQKHHHHEQGRTHSILCPPIYSFAEENHIKKDESLDINHKCKEEDLEKKIRRPFRPALQPRPSKNRRLFPSFYFNDDERLEKGSFAPFFDDEINSDFVGSIEGMVSDVNIYTFDDYDSRAIRFPLKTKRSSSSSSSSVQEEDVVDTTTSTISSPSSSSSCHNSFAPQDDAQSSWSLLTNNDLLTSKPFSAREVPLITPPFPHLCSHHTPTTSTLKSTVFISTHFPQSCLIPLLLSENNRGSNNSNEGNNSSPFFDDGINSERVESIEGNASDINISSLDDYDSSTISFPIKTKRGSSSLSSSVQEEDEVDTTTTSMSSPSSSSSSSYLNDFAQQDVTQTSWSQLTNNDLLTSPPLSDREVSLITPPFPPNCSHPLCYHHISTTSTLNTTFINTPLPQSCLIPLLLSENNRGSNTSNEDNAL